MKIICFGAGAIGSYLGGSLALAGHEVCFVEKEAFIPRLKENGIRIEDINGTKHHLTDIQVYGTAAEALAGNSYDLAMIAVKSFNTRELMESLKDVQAQLPPFLSPQNGVENEDVLREYLGDERVIPVSICTAISRGEQGSIKVARLRGIGIYSGHPLSDAICRAFMDAGLKPKLISDGTAMKWSKMISNLIANASSAILDMPPAEIYTNPVSYRMEAAQVKETLSVMRALGINVIDIPGVPVKLLCWAMTSLPAGIAGPLMKRSVGSGRGKKMPSFYIDLYNGNKQSEVEFLNGAVVRKGLTVGVPTPVNKLYCDTLVALAAGSLPLDTYRHDPQKLYSALEQDL